MRTAPRRIMTRALTLAIGLALVVGCATRPPLHSAARQGDTPQLALLLEGGADPNAIDSGGRTPLHHAASRGPTNMVQMLLQRGARPNVRDENAKTPLHNATRRGYPDIVELLLVAGAEVDPTDDDRATPLMIAARRGHEDIVALLLQYHADPAKRDENRDTAVNIAAERRHTRIVRMLVEAGAPTDVPDENGRTPLYQAVDRRDRETVEVLLENHANPNHVTRDGYTALLRAVENRDAEVVELLLEHGAEPSTARRGDAPAVVKAVRNRDHETLKHLIAARADVDERSPDNGNSPLDIAVQNRDLASAEMLLEAGASLETLNQNGETLLYAAVKNHDYEAATLLIEHGADPDGKNPNGSRPLALAISNRDRAMSALLIEGGAKPTTIGELLADPQDFIAKYGYRKLITAAISQASEAGASDSSDPGAAPMPQSMPGVAPAGAPSIEPAPMQTRKPETPEQQLARFAPAPRKAPSPSQYYSRRVAVVVGIDQYNAWPALEGARRDARAVSAAFRSMGFDDVIEIYDEKATRTRILNALGSDLATLTDANSMAVIYFAGHGQTESLTNGAKRGYIVPVDAHPEQVFATAISMDTLRSISSRLPAKQVYYAMDSCYSGLGFTRGIALKADPGEDYIRKITSHRAVQMITAGADGEQALERGGQGIFTRYFLRALQGEADYDGDGWVTASEIGTYVRPHVTTASNSRQTPRFGTLEGTGEVAFPKSSP